MGKNKYVTPDNTIVIENIINVITILSTTGHLHEYNSRSFHSVTHFYGCVSTE